MKGYYFNCYVLTVCIKCYFNYYFDNLIKVKKIETKNILIDGKNYKDVVIHFTKHVHSKSIKLLSLHYH